MQELKIDSSFLLTDTNVIISSFNGINEEHSKMISKVPSENLNNTVVVLTQNNSNVLSSRVDIIHYLENNNIRYFFGYNNGINSLNNELTFKELFIEKLKCKNIIFSDELIDHSSFTRLCAMNGVNVLSSQHKPEEINKKIVELISEGNISEVNSMLARPYRITGEIVYGKQLGRTVGMPTANLKAISGTVIPASGVYVSLSNIDGKNYIGLTNIGTRPSVDDFEYITIETFYLDFKGNLYSKILDLDIYHKIRDVIKFRSLEKVKEQVNKDIVSAKNYMKNHL